ncbi:helix-turn-helix domain-containing protein [Chitinophaga filiformis]|uniref:helix-turn-helix domain-containing protein n=1 Tax=Chitinophaga filiformis TaxID=104663 RepID=UPI001F15BEB6|nr:helix-turn-helix domain-containing protein [Chitinophaga filiformis]MCF6403088.1 helix-turn-helix domain-containing protein [Chitinophaga filiformis]
MTFAEFFHILILLGFLQGAIMSVLLFFSRKRSRSNRLLGTLILLIALACLNLYLAESPWFTSNPTLNLLGDLIPLVIVMPLGPLLYFYVKSTIDPTFRITPKQRMHFLPVIIDCGPQLSIVIYITAALLDFSVPPTTSVGTFIDDYNVYADIPRWGSLTVYLWLSARYLTKVSSEKDPQREWLRQFIRLFLVFQIIWFIYLVPYVIPSLTDKVLSTVDWYPVYIPLVVLIYCLGLKGYLMTPEEAPVARKVVAPPSEKLVEEAEPLLKKAMEQDRLYLDPELNLAMLSKHTGLPQKTISLVLNQHLQKSFNEFVNGYRVEAFKQNMQLQQDNLTILAMAFDAGFNSQATFQRAFRSHTGMSPREYMNRHLEKQPKPENE